ncbi:aldehyde dehydrogenase family protein [Colwelliaceae bacterium 6471]
MENLNKLFINGQWLTSSSDDVLDVINPSTEQVIAQVVSANIDDVNAAVSAAKNAFIDWSNTSANKRSEIIKAIALKMEQRKAELVTAISQTMGCPEHIASWLQVEGPIEGMALFAEHTHLTESIEEAGSSLIIKEAVGVCAFINPWNYPLHQFVGKVGAALAAGCTMVVKPSEQTPWQDYIMAEIMAECGLPAGVFNLVPGTGAIVGDALSRHPDVDMVSFTGSTQAGIKVAQAAAPTVKRVTQELGGKSPFIITEDADLAAAVKYGVEDVMLNSGQTCTALTRMLVPQSKYGAAVSLAKSCAESLIVGSDDNAFLGAMSSKTQQQRVLDYIQIGLDEGAELICGGLESPLAEQKGFYVAPTIFARVNNQMRIAREEIFGPVLCMIPYQYIDDAIAIANDTPYGLSSGVYAKDETSAIAIARKIRAGQCYINGGFFNYLAPFGGYKQSGNGREFGAIGVEEFLETKAIQRGEH